MILYSLLIPYYFRFETLPLFISHCRHSYSENFYCTERSRSAKSWNCKLAAYLCKIF